ncbi:MAG: polysaccharide deacetylase family protein [Gammaproteobacteria bacterium]|nr:polysaccharide deacetylase family protein [Gammaproteobacteria bacterium]
MKNQIVVSFIVLSAIASLFPANTIALDQVSLPKKIALTLDDSPRSANGYFDGETRSKKLIQLLDDKEVSQVAFFSVSSRLDDEGSERLMRYAKAGHIIANHTHTHPDFNKLTLDEYKQDFLKAHHSLKDYPNFKPWFRFPYLREGDTREKIDSMRNLLKKMDYTNVYITQNNYDWYLESLFQKAVKSGQKFQIDNIKELYVDLMMQSIRYYDDMAIQHLNRSPKHILLLHEMDITALFLGDLIDQLRAEGWQIISPEEALEDPIAKIETKSIFKFNPGRIGEIAKDNDQKKGLWHSSLEENFIEQQFQERVLKIKEDKSVNTN